MIRYYWTSFLNSSVSEGPAVPMSHMSSTYTPGSQLSEFRTANAKSPNSLVCSPAKWILGYWNALADFLHGSANALLRTLPSEPVQCLHNDDFLQVPSILFRHL